MGEKLTDNNPSITDLSDAFRPITLASTNSLLYTQQQ